jgi:tetratricopeptide (TPR) repeat protein
MSFSGSFFKRNKQKAALMPKTDYTQSPVATQRYDKGSIIGGKYEVHSELGHGGLGIVYLVYLHELKQVFALKTFKDEYLEDVETRKLFQREANIWVALDRHPYLVHAFFVEEFSGRLYIALEYIAPDVQGSNTLEAYLRKQPPNLAQSLRWSIQICYGMEYAYSKGVKCHRDIKPENIMITQDKTVKISDFGLAGVLGASKASAIRLNVKQGKVGLSGSIMGGKGWGTPPYMPPEQFTNAVDCDQRSDIYAFGVVLFQMASGGRLPFLASLPRDDSLEEQIRFSREMYKLHSYASVPKLDTPIFSVIQRCLEKDPNRRYPSFKEVRNDLEPILKRFTEVVSPPSVPDLEAWEYLNKGNNLERLGHSEEALECYNRALEINPQYEVEVWNGKGLSISSLGRFEEAITCYDKALKINPMYTNAWHNKGNTLLHLGRFENAIECYNKVLEINSEEAITWNSKAICLDRLGRSNEAINCYSAALEINPQYAEAWSNYGSSFFSLGRFEQAIKCYDKTLEINPVDAGTLRFKRISLVKLERYDEAIKCCNKTLEINPLDAEAWTSKGANLGFLEQYAEAIKCFDKALEIDPQNASAQQLKKLNASMIVLLSAGK